MMELSLLLCTATDVESFQQNIPTKDKISLYNSCHARHLCLVLKKWDNDNKVKHLYIIMQDYTSKNRQSRWTLYVILALYNSLVSGKAMEVFLFTLRI